VRPDPVRAIADAVLYEGYLLWPYRRSALKNQQRFTFGGVFAPAHSASHPDDPCRQQTEVLVRGDPVAQLQVTVRFLHVVARQAMRREGDALVAVDELTIGGRRHLTWSEATEREVRTPSLSLEELRSSWRQAIEIAAGSAREALTDGADGTPEAALHRSWQALTGELQLTAVPLADGLWRVTATIENRTSARPGSRQKALEHAFCSTHTILRTRGGELVSLTDPPVAVARHAAACRNIGTWPVLVGEPGDVQTMLSSPIILEDYPRIAPESPGDLFDGGEIDQLLILNILTLTDEEKAEMAASDPRAQEILRRTEALTPEQLMALHGTIREVGLERR